MLRTRRGPCCHLVFERCPEAAECHADRIACQLFLGKARLHPGRNDTDAIESRDVPDTEANALRLCIEAPEFGGTLSEFCTLDSA